MGASAQVEERRYTLTLVAGSGRLPELVAESLERAGRPYRVLAVRGFTERAMRARASATTDLLDLPGIKRILAEWGPCDVVLAGGVARPGPAALLNTTHALRNRDIIRDVTGGVRNVSGGDDRLLGSIVGLMEKEGHRVSGVHEVAPNLLGRKGQLGRHAPDAVASAAITTGAGVITALAPYDVGQAAVVAAQRVLAVEGPEGTDRMLARARRIGRRPFGHGAAAPGTVLVKLPKQGQDLRIDMPAIGPRTVRCAAAAGCAGIAIGAGHTLVIDEGATVTEADRRGLFLIGIDPHP